MLHSFLSTAPAPSDSQQLLALLVDEGSFCEDGRYVNALADGLPADGVITGTATLDGRPVALMANDWSSTTSSNRRTCAPT